MPEEILHKVRSDDGGGDGRSGRAKTTTLVHMKLPSGSKILNLREYPLRKQARKGIQPVISDFLEYNLIHPCQSPYNTPTTILLVQKLGTQEYCFVQDLRAINQMIEDIH